MIKSMNTPVGAVSARVRPSTRSIAIGPFAIASRLLSIVCDIGLGGGGFSDPDLVYIGCGGME